MPIGALRACGARRAAYLGGDPDTLAGFGAVHPPIAYAKLKAMAEGAAIASAKLWARP